MTDDLEILVEAMRVGKHHVTLREPLPLSKQKFVADAVQAFEAAVQKLDEFIDAPLFVREYFDLTPPKPALVIASRSSARARNAPGNVVERFVREMRGPASVDTGIQDCMAWIERNGLSKTLNGARQMASVILLAVRKDPGRFHVERVVSEHPVLVRFLAKESVAPPERVHAFERTPGGTGAVVRDRRE